MKYLVYSRPRTHSFFSSLLKNLFSENDKIIIISDWPIKNGIDIHKKVSQITKSFKVSVSEYFWDKQELKDIVIRDRLLRNLENPAIIEMLVNGYTKVLSEIFKKTKPDAIISIPMDCYIIDIMERLAKKRGIPFWQIVGSPVKGRTRLTKRGELYEFNFEGSSEELSDLCISYMNEIRNKNYLPNYVGSLNKSFFYFYKIIIKDSIKKQLFRLFNIFRPYQFNFYNMLLDSKNKMIANNFRNITSKNYFDKKYPDSNYVYFPLQWYPETSIDYFSNNTDFLPYYKWLFRIVNEVSKDFPVLIKEHPVAIGYRPIHIYDRLKSLDNVFLLSSNIHSKKIMRNSLCSLTFGTTTSIESIVLKKPAITIGKPYYDYKNLFTKIVEKTNIKSITNKIKSNKKKEITDDEIIDFLTYFIKCTLNGYGYFVDFNKKNHNKMDNLLKLRNSLRKNKEILFNEN